MNKPKFNYDKISDSLSVVFAENESSTGIELNENVLLKVDLKKKCAVSITLFNYSLLSKPSEFGVRSFPLTELSDLPKEIREIVVNILISKPVNKVLSVSDFTPSVAKHIPITSISSRILDKKAA
jgi:uncharacterized protein YuzE